MRKLARLVLLAALWMASGCLAAEIQAQNRAVNEQNRQVYEIYRSYMQSSNQERELSGLPPRPIKSFEEWRQSPGTD